MRDPAITLHERSYEIHTHLNQEMFENFLIKLKALTNEERSFGQKPNMKCLSGAPHTVSISTRLFYQSLLLTHRMSFFHHFEGNFAQLAMELSSTSTSLYTRNAVLNGLSHNHHPPHTLHLVWPPTDSVLSLPYTKTSYTVEWGAHLMFTFQLHFLAISVDCAIFFYYRRNNAKLWAFLHLGNYICVDP